MDLKECNGLERGQLKNGPEKKPNGLEGSKLVNGLERSKLINGLKRSQLLNGLEKIPLWS